jgi:hypothetical protein
MFDGSVSAVPNLASYLTGGTGGTVTLSIPASIVNAIPAGTYRYKIAMAYGSVPLSPTWDGPFLVNGLAPTVIILPPGVGGATTDNPGFGVQITEEVVEDGVHPLITWNPTPFYLTEMRLLQTASGSVTVTVNQNGTAIPGWTNIVATTTPQTVAPTTSPVLVTVGDSLSVTYSANSAALSLQATLSGSAYSG